MGGLQELPGKIAITFVLEQYLKTKINVFEFNEALRTSISINEPLLMKLVP
jgi:hypothetical protein